MPHDYFLERMDAKYVQWWINFDNEVQPIGSTLGLSAADLQDISDTRKNIVWAYAWLQAILGEKKQVTKFKNILFWGELNEPISYTAPAAQTSPPAALTAGSAKKLAKYAKTIKSSKNYTEAIGKQLGIIGSEIIIDFDNLKSALKCKAAKNDGNDLTYSKLKTDGCILYSFTYGVDENPPKDFDDIPWVAIAHIKAAKYTDHRPNRVRKPEIRLYMVRLVYNDQIVGKPSDILRVVTEIYYAADGSELVSIPK